MLKKCFKASYYYNTFVLFAYSLFYFYVILVKSNIRKRVLPSIVKSQSKKKKILEKIHSHVLLKEMSSSISNISIKIQKRKTSRHRQVCRFLVNLHPFRQVLCGTLS